MYSSDLSAFVTFSREEWANLAQSAELPLTAADIQHLAALGDPITLAEVDAIYRPLTALMHMYARNTERLFSESKNFLGFNELRVPWIVGIAGSVSAGKSTVARLLRELLSRSPQTPRVDLVTTDGFLLPNKVLDQRRLLTRKGFPESYDRRAILAFLAAVKSGRRHVTAPVYDHVTYDIVPNEYIVVDRPDILIVEGLNVLQPAPGIAAHEFSAVSDFFDFTIYVDAPEDALERWYIERFLKLRSTAFTNDASYFRNYANLTDDQARETARQIWGAINLPNLRHNIAPTRNRATVVLTKGEEHNIEQVKVRKL
ncbi:type I pantothenate kinase [Arcanobacterium pinnipediorum]|uniref:Pantothenate kinase n=1 Tax=Arcanobacterium pinnipediorum TaxID=1503041 RepID=A0ABY5AGD1_9ACTO|nr:type I pantothenate kinase [Arcanobacterium pinnipediorum]USR79060.1 type I pantothenate kinase [Arcanobacterium pinnipediorum]